MGKSAPAQPTPDYVGAAQATAAGNLQDLQYQTQANRPTTVTPWGTESWTQGTSAYGQPSNSWTDNVSLTPAEQASLTAQQSVQTNQSNLALGLEGQASSTMAPGFQAPNVNSYLSGVPGINSGFSAFNSNGIPQTNTAQQTLNTTGVPGVNVNAPQFNQSTANAGANAAFNASEGMIQPLQQQATTNLDTQLRLQGLTPGTQAYNTAMSNQLNANSNQNDQLANQSVLTGNTEANTNYASQLEGYNAGNAAQGQDYGQALSSYNAGLEGQQAYNTAQSQDYGQALGDYTTGQQAVQSQNTAAQEALAQNTSEYNTQYGAAFNQYMEPLNAMNAALTGQQVQSPQFNAPSSTSGYVPGTDYTTAAQNTGQYNSGVQAQQQSADNATTSSIGSLAAMAAAYFI